MAENIKEPTVSVHGVPKSQYDASAPIGGPPSGPMIGGGSSIGQDIRAHPIWAVSIGIGVVAILIMVYLYFANNNNSSSNQTASTIDPLTGIPYSQETGNTPYGTTSSQLDADYQQMMSYQNEMIGLLQQIQTGQTGSGGNNPPPPPTTNPEYGTVRSGTSKGFDASHSGVPIWSNITNRTGLEGYIPFNAGNIDITGPAVAGALNAKGGSNLWYPVDINGENGFISAFDLSNFYSNLQGTGGIYNTPLIPPGTHGPVATPIKKPTKTK